MDAMGLESKFKIKAADVPNVEATIKHHERYILYNPEFVNKVNEVTKDKWASIFILAHEVGHHLDGHTEAGLRSCPAIELEADQFAGFVLCKMGATLHQSQLAMYYISDMASSKTHPGRLDRLAAIEKGWNKAQMQKELASSSVSASQRCPSNKLSYRLGFTHTFQGSIFKKQSISILEKSRIIVYVCAFSYPSAKITKI